MERPDFHSGLEQGPIIRFGGELHEAFVGVGPGQQEVDFDTALHGTRESVEDLGVGREVCGRDADSLLRELAQGAEQGEDVAVSDLGRAAHTLHGGGTRFWLVGEQIEPFVE